MALKHKLSTWKWHGTLPIQCKNISNTYSPLAHTFPLGIKMHVVPEIHSMTNPDTHAKAVRLYKLQAKPNSLGDMQAAFILKCYMQKKIATTLMTFLSCPSHARQPTPQPFYAVRMANNKAIFAISPSSITQP